MVAFADFSLQQSNLTQLTLVFLRKFDSRQTGLAGPVDTCQGFHSEIGLNTAHSRRFVMLQAPDPLVQTLKNHIFHGSVPFDLGHCQINFGIVSPNAGKCAMLYVCYGQIKAKLQFIINWNSIIRPTVSFVISTAFAFENARLAVSLPFKTPVKIGQSVRMICMLIESGIFIDVVTGLMRIPVSGNRFQKVSHLKLICIGFFRRFHAAFFDKPQLQRCCPGRYTENGCDITASDGIRDIPFRAVHTAFEPPIVAHTGGITQ